MLLRMINIVKSDPGVENALGFTGGANTARMFISLKPLKERKLNATQIIARLRPQLAKVPGATLYLQATQDVRIGGRQSSAEYQFVMQGDNLSDLVTYAPRMLEKLKTVRIITDANSDLQNQGLQAIVSYDRSTAARFNIAPQLIDDTLYDAFGQRQVSTMYTSLNQYHVVMEVAPEFWQNPEFLRQVYISSPSGQMVPLSDVTTSAAETAPLAVTHQGLFPAVTISFNLAPNASLGDAVNGIESTASAISLRGRRNSEPVPVPSARGKAPNIASAKCLRCTRLPWFISISTSCIDGGKRMRFRRQGLRLKQKARPAESVKGGPHL